jgi:hypothetical protein
MKRLPTGYRAAYSQVMARIAWTSHERHIADGAPFRKQSPRLFVAARDGFGSITY